MAMVRNESVARIVMLLCFGTAILSLAVRGRMTNSQASDNASQAGGKAVAIGAALPDVSKRNEPSNSSNTAGNNPLKSLLAQGLPGQTPSKSQTENQTQIVVNLSDRRVYVYRQAQVIASYPIGVGKKGWETPTGSFQVLNKLVYPIWRHPITGKVFQAGTDSPLGDRWIGFWSDGQNQIGFHGTPDEELVGSSISHGCLRMRNPDIRMLYKQVKMGTPVEVRSYWSLD
ncbi:L,D-transpeptidase [Aetokthonos hydrillicola Thurmond2011]|jgi:lipoprotein-anchoring transpeptidase ErfK/SrfK|uniref:L,D-transpeptidase n=1 Tax=Aetokthonos hydrillicola Thurmond2011 TaxID=2712845 RepID=A0AAP5IGI9_9CYAN|nr:L,D-transpeptidase [Aetokthonos hydrillicola]MBO3464332.1 L,D-transpeptidase [Aetokthonos hydrillicola CCALA 1050]MBW4590027.1 L,D-transpeptidase [Aetokthonos hydrillicola CCALA 1050]MDR9900607.1 L,D-transpeptidase [Aetokthonos hydrillicola Thurmond2011]